MRGGAALVFPCAHCSQMCCLLHMAALALQTHTQVPAPRELCMQRSWPARALPAAMSVLMTMQSYASNVHAVASLRCSWNMTTLPLS